MTMSLAGATLHLTQQLVEPGKSREVYWGLSHLLKMCFYAVAVLSVSAFLVGVVLLYLEYRRGRVPSSLPIRRLAGRVGPTLLGVYSHRRFRRRDPLAGWAHRGILFGFTVLFIGTVLIAIDTDITQPLLGWSFLTGNTFLVYKVCLNVAGVLFLSGLVVMVVRRGLIRPAKLDYTPQDPDGASSERKARLYSVGDWTFLVTLLLIGLTGFALEGVRLAMDRPGYEWSQFGGMPFAWLFGSSLDDLGLNDARRALWWVHALLALMFVASIPFTKASHMLTATVNLALSPVTPASSTGAPVERGQQEEATRPGYRTIADLSRLHLLQTDSCTKCGKCHEACPARAMGRPLSPRDIVLELREQARHDLRPHLRGRTRAADLVPLVGDGVISSDAIWSCTQCNACVEICPVGIEQAPMINLLRQASVDEGDLPPELADTFERIRHVGNSFGVEAGERGSWTALAPELTIADARVSAVDVLWFVGDHASFDPQAQRVAVSLARVLTAAGVSFGILYDSERNSGNDVRAAGEAGLFEELAAYNIETLEKCTFSRIMTSDPHSFNALRKSYPELGGNWTVLHHTELLLELIDQGKLDVTGAVRRRVTYHDPCFLGRHNGVYDAPRQILERLGCVLVEMPRNRDNSFCCGAGGGRIWMKDPVGVERPSDSRIREAAALDVDLYVVSCPKDVIMYEAAIRDTGNADRLELRELTMLVEEALLVRHTGGVS